MQESDEVLVTTDHARRLKLCASGGKQVMVKMYGEAVWRQFVLRGYPASEFIKSSHPDIRAAAELAYKDAESK